MLEIKTRWIAIAAYVTLAAGIVVFFVGWLKSYIGIPAALVLAAGIVWVVRKDYGDDQASVRMPAIHLILQIVLFAFVVFLSGIAGVGVAGYDIPYRNAIFNDIMAYSWPIRYEDGYAMVYYCVFWLVPALVGKLFGQAAGYAALGVFAVWVITLTHLLVLALLRIRTPGKMWLSALFLMLWSGLQFLGAAVTTMMGWNLYDYGILTDGSSYLNKFFNGEAFNWFYRSNFSVLTEPYNQLVIWLAVPLMLSKRTAHSYMCLGLLLLPYSPWAFIGIFPLLIVAAGPWMIQTVRDGKALQVLKCVLSPGNVAALVTIVPIFALYFMASSRTAGAASANIITPDQVESYVEAGLHYTTQTGSFGILSLDRFGWRNVVALALFWVLEFGVYLFLIAPKFRRENPLFWAVLVMLLACPLIWVGTVGGRDFCMNASIPPLFVLMIWTLQYVCEDVVGKPFGRRALCLVVALTLAFTGPAFGLMDRCRILKAEGSLAVMGDEIGSLANLDHEYTSNFLADNVEDKAFFKYLAR